MDSIIKRIILLSPILLIFFFTNCLTAPIGDGSPVQNTTLGGITILQPGGTYTYPAPGFNLAQTNDLGSKTGSSCITQSNFLIFTTMIKGDMSIYAAAKSGRISKVKLVSYQVTRPANLFGWLSIFNDTTRYCTIVHGD
ncbi:MAG: TRL domain-containing protein [Spirochaetota bacterium]